MEGRKKKKMTNAKSDKDVLCLLPLSSLPSLLFSSLALPHHLPPASPFVLKCRFNYHLSVVRPINQEIIATEHSVLLTVPNRSTMP